MKVSDAMSKQVDFVVPATTVRDVSRLIFGRNINGVPVCEGRKLVGFITERDILAKFYPSMQEYVEDTVHASDFEAMEEGVSEILLLKAKDIMSKNPTTVSPQTPLLRAQSAMLIHKVGRLPVVDRRGTLVGILSKGDIFRAVVGERLDLAEDEEYNDWLSKRYYLTVDWKNRLSLEMPDLMKVFRKYNVEKVLDIGCGTGEHVIELARRGLTAWGIERSKLMVNSANSKLESIPESIRKRITFLCGEYGDILPKLKKEEFHAALVMGNSISHNAYRDEEVIKQTAHMLTRRRILIFQVTNFEKILKAQKRLLNFSFVKSDYAASAYHEHLFLEYYDLPQDGGKTILKTFAIFDFTGKKWKFYGLRNALFAHATKERIAKALKKSGYGNISFYGSSFDGRKWDHLFRKPFKPLESDWLNILAVG